MDSTGIEVRLIDSMGSDASIAQAARVSIQGENTPDDEHDKLINYLMKSGHGSPFEHTTLKFYVKAPIFVFREFHRHRVGFSYNEMSGRYTQLPPEFYIPGPDRPMRNIGTSARPEMAPMPPQAQSDINRIIERSYIQAWEAYQTLLIKGVANEVARLVLPVGIMSQMYVTCNARSMMNFLSLRTQDDRAARISRPQYEIQVVARMMEAHFEELFPLTYESYNNNGRIAP